MTRPAFDLSVYLVVGPADCAGRTLGEVVSRALAGGATLIQLRDKNARDQDFLEFGRALLPLCRAAGVPLIVNDRLEAALALQADGLHLGQDDMDAAEARDRLGPDRLLGLSAGNRQELSRVPQGLVDYLGVGPVYATATKDGLPDPIGLGTLRAVTRAVDVPVIAIAGITAARIPEVLAAGAHGVAVVGAVADADDPTAATRELLAALEQRP